MKLLTSAGTGRGTVEADLLILAEDGTRAGVDVKHIAGQTYRAVPSRRQLAGVEAALARGEITSCHFVTNRRFAPVVRRTVEAACVRSGGRVFWHEHVWPAATHALRTC